MAVNKSKKQFAVMKWTNDGDTLSCIHLKHILEPRKPFDDYEVGDEGVARCHGFCGQWTFLILAVGETKPEMEVWLREYLDRLHIDDTEPSTCTKKQKAVEKTKITDKELQQRSTTVTLFPEKQLQQRSTTVTLFPDKQLQQRSTTVTLFPDKQLQQRSTTVTLFPEKQLQQRSTTVTLFPDKQLQQRSTTVTLFPDKQLQQRSTTNTGLKLLEKIRTQRQHVTEKASQGQPDKVKSINKHDVKVNIEPNRKTQSRMLKTPPRTSTIIDSSDISDSEIPLILEVDSDNQEDLMVDSLEDSEVDSQDDSVMGSQENSEMDSQEDSVMGSQQNSEVDSQENSDMEVLDTTPEKNKSVPPSWNAPSESVLKTQKSSASEKSDVEFVTYGQLHDILDGYVRKSELRKLKRKLENAVPAVNEGEQELENIIKQQKNEYMAVEAGLFHLFTKEEINTHSATGKKANRSTPAKPKFDPSRFDKMSQLVKKHFNISDKELVLKTQNVKRKVAKMDF